MEDNFSPQQSLQVIQSMIEKTRANLSENSIYFLLWGWVTFGAILGQFFLKVVIGSQHHYLVWFITLPTAVITMVYSLRRHGRNSIKTYAGESMGFLWTGVGISFFVLCFIITTSDGGWATAWPYFILMYGLGTFVSGKILQFTPLIIGGIINWLLAIGSAFVHFDYQLLLAATAILISYIIPGHLLRSQKNK